MNSYMDRVKGRLKQGLGGLTGDKKMQREGRNDERVGRAKQHASDGIDAVRKTIEDVPGKVSPTDTTK